MSESLWEEATI